MTVGCVRLTVSQRLLLQVYCVTKLKKDYHHDSWQLDCVKYLIFIGFLLKDKP
jgi:hypothetical protein